MSKQPKKMSQIQTDGLYASVKVEQFTMISSLEKNSICLFLNLMVPRVKLLKEAYQSHQIQLFSLPHDPKYDRVLLVERFPAGPYVKGNTAPWCLQPIAGLIDSGETSEQGSMQEAQEEARLTVLRLELVALSYPSPGISAEFFSLVYWQYVTA